MKTLVLICILFVSNSFAQISPTPGASKQLDSNEQLNELVGVVQKKLIVSVKDRESHVVKLISTDQLGKELNSFSLSKVFPEDIFFHVSYDKVIVLTTLTEGKKRVLRLQTLGPNLKLLETKDVLSHEIDSDIHAGGFVIEHSRNGNTFAVLHEIPNDLGGPEMLVIHAYDPDFNELWSSSFKTKLKQTNNPTNRLVVGNNGTVHVVKRHRKGNDFSYYVYQFIKDKNPVRHPLDLRGPRVSELNMTCDNQGNLLVSGFYTTTTFDESVGYFHRIYGADGHVKTKIQRAFKPAFMEKFIGKKAHKKGASLRFVEISAIISAGSNYLIVYENQLRETSKSKGSDKIDEINTNGPIHIECIDSKGDFVKATDIPVTQETWNSNSYFSSFFGFDLIPDKINQGSLIYNTISSDKTMTMTISKTTILNSKENGEHKLINVSSDQLKKDGSMLISPRLTHRSGENWYFILTDKNRQQITPAHAKHSY